MPNQHVVVFNRWRDNFARYEDYIDHSAHRITYVTTPIGKTNIPAAAAAVIVVDDPADENAVRLRLGPVVARFGTPIAVVALHERDLAVAASLRAEYDTVGRRPEQLYHFVDKHAMLLAARKSGVRIPEFAVTTTVAAVHAFGSRVGWPVIAKQLSGSGSSGVSRLDGPDACVALRVDSEHPVLLQEYVPHRVHHVDGLFAGGRLGPWRLSAYLNVPGSVTTGPLAFLAGEPVGSVEIDDQGLRGKVEAFLNALLPIMSADPWVFHLELFIATRGAESECIFLEAGCRPGGGDIPFVWREVHGVDLMELEFRLQCGDTPQAAPFPDDEPVGGCLLVPLTVPQPCRVLEATPMCGHIAGLYAEVVPAAGGLVTAGSGYEFAGGRFRFRGRNTARVADQVLAAAAGYRLRCEPVEPARA